MVVLGSEQSTARDTEPASSRAPEAQTEATREDARAPALDVERLADFAGPQRHTAEIDRRQHDIREQLSETPQSNGGTPDPQAQQLSAVFNEKVNFLQGQIRELRQQAELLQRSDNRDWMQLEGAANLSEQRLLALFEDLDTASLSEAAPEFSRAVDQLISQLELARLDRGTEARSGEMTGSIDQRLAAVFEELGIDVPLDDPEVARLLLQQHRELLGDQATVLGDLVQKERDELQHQLEQLNEQTREHEYGLLDTFTGRYDTENAMDRRQIEHIGRISQRLQALETALGEQQAQIQTIDAGLNVLHAQTAAAQGNDMLAARYLAGLQEGSTAALLNQQQPALSELAREATAYLQEHDALSSQEQLLYGDADTHERLDTAVQLFNTTEQETAATMDIRDQILSRETYRVGSQGNAADLFRATPQFEGQARADILSLQYRRLNFVGSDADGESRLLLFDREAAQAWDGIPAGAQPLLLKPRDTLDYQTEIPRRQRPQVTFGRDPERSRVRAEDVGYTLNGKTYRADGTEIDVSQHPQRRWIERQLSESRSFSTMQYQAPAEIRVLDPGSGERIPLREQLYSIRTANGETIHGVRLSDEVRQLLDERPPEGTTLVLRRTPHDIPLSGRQTEPDPQSRGRQQRTRAWYGTMGAIDEIRIEDLAYARIDNGTLQVQSIEETRAGLVAAPRIRLGQSEGFSAERYFTGTVLHEGRSQQYLRQYTMRRLVFHGGEQEGRELTLAFPTDADRDWRSLPADAQPVLLRPFSSPEVTTRRSGGRNSITTSIIHNRSHEFVVQSHEIGYFRDGKLFTHQHQEVQIEGHEHEAWIRSQLEHGRSIDAVRLSYRTPLVSADGRERISEPLYRLTRPDGSRTDGVHVDPEVLELLRQELPPGTSIVLKREPQALELGRDFERNGETLRQALRPPDRITLEDVALSTPGANGFSLSNVTEITPEEQNLDADELRHLERDRADEVLRILSQDEDIAHMQSAALSMYQTLSHLQSSLQAHGVGSSREEFVEFVRSEAKPLHEFLNSPDTAQRVARLEVQLAQLKQLQRGVADGETEAQIAQQIRAIEQFVQVVKDPKIKNVIETLLDTSKFGPDNWAHWSTNELPVIAGSVAGAVAGAALVVGTAGAAGVVVVPLWATAAGIAVGGLVGMELSREGLYYLHNNIGSAAEGHLRYGDRSTLGTKLSGTAVFNPNTGQYEQISWGQVGAEYGTQLAVNYVMGYATMFGSNVLAGQMTRLLQNTLVMERIAAHSPTAQAALRYLATAEGRVLNAAEQQQLRAAFQEAFRRMPVEFLDEMSDEALEKVGEEFFSSISRSMGLSESGRIEGTLAALLIGTLKGTRLGPAAVGYDANTQSPAEVQTLLDDARSQGYVVQDIGRGYYTLLNPQTAQKVTLRPFTETELAQRQEQQSPSTDSSTAASQTAASQAAATETTASAERFEIRRQLFQLRVQQLREQHPEDWQARLQTELGRERQMLLEAAQQKLEADGVSYEARHDAEGSLQSLIISAERGTSGLNTYAYRMQQARGVALEYDPALLATQEAGALYDSEARRIMLPHEVVLEGQHSQQVYHEKIHAVFDGIRAQGGDSLFFGSIELQSGELSLDEYATYNELIARDLQALQSSELSPEDATRIRARVEQHLAVFSSFNSEVAALLPASPSPELAQSVALQHQIRIGNDGVRRIHIVGQLEINGQQLSMDLASAEQATELPSRAQLQQRMIEKLGMLQQSAAQSQLALQTISNSLENANLSAAASAAQALRSGLSRNYLLSPVTPTASAEDELRLPPAPGRERFAASPETESTIDFPNLEQVLANTEAAQRPAHEQQRTPLERHMRVQDAIDPFEVRVQGERLSLTFEDGSSVETNVTLSPAAVEQLFRQLRAQANAFGPRVSNNLDQLQAAVELAQLNGAFYGSNQVPQEAAQALQTFLRNHDFPAGSIRILEGHTAAERLAALQRFADNSTQLAQALEPRYQGQQVNEQMLQEFRAELERQYGARALEQVLAAHDDAQALSFDQLIEQLESAERSRTRPVTLEIRGRDISDANGDTAIYRFSIERMPDGRLGIEQLSPSLRGSSDIHSLEQLLQRLEDSTTYPGQRPLWRNHARVETEAFRPSTIPGNRYRPSHEEGIDTDAVVESLIAFEQDPASLTQSQQAGLYWQLDEMGELELATESARQQLEQSARADMLENAAFLQELSPREAYELSARIQHFGLSAQIDAKQQQHLQTLLRMQQLLPENGVLPAEITDDEVLELHNLVSRSGLQGFIQDFNAFEDRVTAVAFGRIASWSDPAVTLDPAATMSLYEAVIDLGIDNRVEPEVLQRVSSFLGFDAPVAADVLVEGSVEEAQVYGATELQARLENMEELSPEELRAYAELLSLPVVQAYITQDERIPENHPQRHQLRYETALRQLALGLSDQEHRLHREELEQIVSAEVARSGLSRSEVVDLLFHLTRYSNLGGTRVEQLTVGRQDNTGGRQTQYSQSTLYQVPVEGLLSLNVALHREHVYDIGSSNERLRLYTPNTGGTADQLAYFLNRRNLGGSGTAAGQSSHPLLNRSSDPENNRTTEDISRATVVLVDEQILARLRSDPQFRADAIASRARFVVSPELVGGIGMGTLSTANSEQALQQRLALLADRYAAIPNRDLSYGTDMEAVRSALVSDTLTELETLLEGRHITVLELNELQTSLSDNVVTQINGGRQRVNHLGTIAQIDRALQAFGIQLKPEEQALFAEALAQSLVDLDNRQLAGIMQEMKPRIEAQAAAIARELDPSGALQAEVYYVVPSSGKSYQHIAGMYRNANGLDSQRFLRPEQVRALREQLAAEGKLLVPVILDDVAATGNSMIKVNVAMLEGRPLLQGVDVRHVQDYADYLRTGKYKGNLQELRVKLFGDAEGFAAPPGQHATLSIIAPLLATERAQQRIAESPASLHSTIVVGQEIDFVQDTAAWQELMALPGMTPARRADLQRAMRHDRATYISDGSATLVQMPHGDSNTNLHWWQDVVAPSVMPIPEGINRYYEQPR